MKSIDGKWYLISLLFLACLRLTLWKNKQTAVWTDCSILIAHDKGSPLTVRMWNESARVSSGQIKNYTTTGMGSLFRTSSGERVEWLGRKVEWEGTLRCQIPFRNFSGSGRLFSAEIEEPKFYWSSNGLVRKVQKRSVHWWLKAHSQYLEFLESRLSSHPQLLGLVLAVWMGSMEGLSVQMQEIYRDGGLLHLLAISGQHVVIGVFLVLLGVQAGARLFSLGVNGRRFYSYCVLALPSLVSLLLVFTSLGSPSILRTLAMALSLFILRLRRFQSSTLQELCSSLAILIVISPQLLMNLGFCLSALATYLLLKIGQPCNFKTGIKRYFFVGMLMPILMIPISIFYFGKFSWVSLISNLVVSWTWELCWIPLGFVLPIVSVLPATLSVPIFDFFESLWSSFEFLHLDLQMGLNHSVLAMVRLNAVEALLIEAIFLTLLASLVCRINNNASSSR